MGTEICHYESLFAIFRTQLGCYMYMNPYIYEFTETVAACERSASLGQTQENQPKKQPFRIKMGKWTQSPTPNQSEALCN